MSYRTRHEREAVSIYHNAGMGTYRPTTVQYGGNDVLYYSTYSRSRLPTSTCTRFSKLNYSAFIRQWISQTALFRSLGFRRSNPCQVAKLAID